MATLPCSVIIPCYNYGRYLAQALDSVLAQTMAPEEIVVVDDGSQDNTREVAASYAGRGVTYHYQPNAGLSAARNTAFRHSTGKYVALLDADDAFHPRKLELQIAVLEQNDGLGALGTLATSWPGPFAPVDPGVSQAASALSVVPLGELACAQQFIASSMVVRRSAVSAWMPEIFDTALRGAEDWDCWLRIAEAATVANLLLPLTGFRDQVTGLGTQPHIMGPALDRVLQKATDRGLWRRPGLEKVRSRAYAHCQVSVAIMKEAHGQHAGAMLDLLRSCRLHPGSMGKPRAKLGLVAMLRLLRLKPSHEQAIRQA